MLLSSNGYRKAPIILYSYWQSEANSWRIFSVVFIDAFETIEQKGILLQMRTKKFVPFLFLREGWIELDNEGVDWQYDERQYIRSYIY
jgi:hypothetical protein